MWLSQGMRPTPKSECALLRPRAASMACFKLKNDALCVKNTENALSAMSAIEKLVFLPLRGSGSPPATARNLPIMRANPGGVVFLGPSHAGTAQKVQVTIS